MTGLKASEEHDLIFSKYHYGICVEIRQQWHKSADNKASEKGATVVGAGTDGNSSCGNVEKCISMSQNSIQRQECLINWVPVVGEEK